MMRKNTSPGIAIFLFFFALSACSNDSESKLQPASITFVDSIDDTSKEFTINEKFEFKVKFVKVETGSFEEVFFIKPGDIVSGKIVNPSGTWTSSPISGTAKNLGSPNNKDLNDPLSSLNKLGIFVNIILTYNKIGDEINSVTVGFPDPGDDYEEVQMIAQMSEELMGGTYYKID